MNLDLENITKWLKLLALLLLGYIGIMGGLLMYQNTKANQINEEILIVVNGLQEENPRLYERVYYRYLAESKTITTDSSIASREATRDEIEAMRDKIEFMRDKVASGEAMRDEIEAMRDKIEFMRDKVASGEATRDEIEAHRRGM